jgi:hypothetical protein
LEEFLSVEAVAYVTPQRAPSNVGGSPKRSRARPLTLLDRRSVAARRIAELKQLFTTALADAGVNVGTPTRRVQIEQAASAMAVAESARGHCHGRAQGGRFGLAPERPRREQPSLAPCMATRAASETMTATFTP